ncbi:MAG: (Fe-S)-binding protein [Acidimicrobiia bacterium]|nr:(Fe-S)-binding protein [Acidimicrobiia bacterium]
MRGRVELFAGCLMSTLLAPLDIATGELLAAAGYEVVITQAQTCCGALAAHGGDLATARELAQRNLDAFTGRDMPIVVNSAGCGAFLHEYPHHVGNAAAALADRVVDVSELLVEAPLDLTGPPPPGPVAYQDACHARLAQGIVEAPRALLGRIPGLELVELADPTMCCGSAGVYNLLHPETGNELGRRRAETVRAAAARTVITSNPGCLLQMRSHLARDSGEPVAVRHLVDVLRDACPTAVERVPPEGFR